MIMRYHWGLAIGHVYTHGQATTTTDGSTLVHAAMSSNLEDETDQLQAPELLDHTNEPDPDAEFSLKNRDDDLGEEDEASEGEHAEESDSDDEQLVAMHDMYGPDFDG